MNSLDAFKIPEKTIRLGKAAIDSAEFALRDFIARDDTMPFIRELNSNTGRYEHKIVQARDLPDAVEFNATSAINLLKNSFDQSLFAVCAAIGQPRNDTHYPWTTDPNLDLIRRLSATISKNSDKLKIPKELWKIIKKQEPYGKGAGYSGGDDVVRNLAKIANSKHTIGFVICAQVVGHSAHFGFIGCGDCVYMPTPKWDPKEKQIILFESTEGTDLKDQHRVSFRLTYPEESLLAGLPVVDTLRAFADKAYCVLEDFKAEASKLGAS